MERGFEEPSPGLEARIISAAARVKRPEARKSSVLGPPEHHILGHTAPEPRDRAPAPARNRHGRGLFIRKLRGAGYGQRSVRRDAILRGGIL